MLLSSDLLDPDKIAGDRYDYYNEKIRAMKTLLARSPQKGGMPFIYAFSMSKEHVLKSVKIPFYTDEKTGKTIEIGTAATDGKRYLWDPQVLEENNPFELTYIMAHETYHQIFQHCDSDRNFAKIKFAWAAAIDYVVHSMVEQDVRTSGRTDLPNFNIHSQAQYPKGQHPMWSGNVGGALTFDVLIKQLKEMQKNKKNGVVTPPGPPPNLTKAPSFKDCLIYADYKTYQKSAEDLYREIIKYMDQDMEDAAGQFHPGVMGIAADSHIESQLTDQELLNEVLEAATSCERTAGTVPGAIKDMLKELMEPTLTWQDMVRHTLQTIRQEQGSKNDWSRYRRRAISMGLYLPKKKDIHVNWCAVLDTSGSMSVEDMTYGVSQLKALDGRSTGVVVPNDAQPYWDAATPILSMKDLPKINPVGRGGTCFAEFFDKFEKQLNKPFDVLIVMTDGEIFDLPQCKKPKCDVVWVIVTDHKAFSPPFGRVAPMRKFQSRKQ